MDPASSFLAGHAAGKLMDKLGATFRTHVIDRWSRRRAEAFFEQLCRELAATPEGSAPEDLEARLTRLVEDETCSEVLFDAYRRVSLAKSRDLGPRIIALLTAKIVAGRRVASDQEDSIFLAAENLTDDELTEVRAFAREQQQKRKPGESSDKWLRVMWNDERFDSSWHQTSSISTAPLDLNECLGRWAVKLKGYGLLGDDVRERQYEYQPGERRHSLDGGSVRDVEWWIDISPACFTLADLIDRVRSEVGSESAKASG
jgi:hypothetical protein